MLTQVASEINVSLSQVREVASDETVEARRVEHSSNHFNGVVVGVDQRDDLPRGGRGGLSHGRPAAVLVELDIGLLRRCATRHWGCSVDDGLVYTRQTGSRCSLLNTPPSR